MLTDLNKKLDKAKDLTQKLDKSLALEYLWPEVFDHGRSRAHWFGPAGTNSYPNMPMRERNQPVHLYHEFHVFNGKDELRCFDYENTPEILGGGLKKENYRRVSKATKA